MRNLLERFFQTWMARRQLQGGGAPAGEVQRFRGLKGLSRRRLLTLCLRHGGYSRMLFFCANFCTDAPGILLLQSLLRS